MQHSEQFAQVAGALAAAQGAFPTIPRDRTVRVRTRKTTANGDPIEYEFKYAPLETILEKIRPHLAKAELALLQSVTTDDKGAEFVRTLLVHSSGEWFANEIPVFTSGADNASQAYASGLTYARRYGVTTLLVLAADEDDDGNGNDEGRRATRPQGRNGGGNREPYRGSFPKSGGGSSEAPAEPREKARPSDAALAPLTGEGAPLGAGPQKVLEAKAKAARLSMEEVLQKFGPVTMANLNDVLRQLGELANAE